jgi:23S rRNA pseudouridine2605 synthase
VIVSARDSMGRTTLYEALPPGLPRVMPVGRLDLNSEGLLLLSTDGALNQTLMSPQTGLEREYRVRVFGELTEAQLAKFREGVTVKGVAYGRCKVFLEKGRPEGRNRWYKVVLTEGKNREIRKIFMHFGCTVNRLIRERYGSFKLGNLPRNVVAELPAQQVKVLMKNFDKITAKHASQATNKRV